MQMSFNSEGSLTAATRPGRTLAELLPGESGVIDTLELPADVAQRLMELGFVPGNVVEAVTRAPGGDPRVFRVDGAEIALRAETAEHMKLRPKVAVGG